MANETPQPEPIQVIFAKGTDTGRSRDHNEDYVDAFSLSDPVRRGQKGDLFIVADGMGGHQAGEVASERAVHVASHDYYADPDQDLRASLIRSISNANADIHQQAQQSAARAGMGTTIVAAVVRGRELIVANVGDSRAYMVRQGTIKQITHDHSFVAEQIRAGILTREEARTHPQRNVITRALGSKPNVQVDSHRGDLLPGDKVLLCSDGLSEHVPEEDLFRLLEQYAPQDAVARLIALANSRGGSDNITALVFQAVSPASAAPTQPSIPVAQPATKGARKGLSWPWIAGIGGTIVIAAVLAIGGLVVAPRLLSRKPAATPTVATSAAVATPTGTTLPSPQASATLQPTASVPATATPRSAFTNIEPPDGSTARPGEVVTFRWDWIGEKPDFASFAVNSSLGTLCRSSEQTCEEALEGGDYEWWVELYSGVLKKEESPHQTLYVRWPTATPTNTPIPPTPSLIPTVAPPTQQPSSGSGDGGGDGGGGTASEPVR